MADVAQTTPSDVPAEVSAFLNEPESQLSTPVSTSGSIEPKVGSHEPDLGGLPPEVESLVGDELRQEKYGSLGQKGKTALEGIATGIAGPLATAAEVGSGIATPEDILARREANPITHYGSEALGLILPAVVTSGMSAEARAGLEGLNQLGLTEGAAKAIAPEAGETLASKIGATAAKGAIENALLAGSDETSKLILQDPNQSAESAIMSVGLGGVLGGTAGGAIGAVPKLWEQVLGSKAGKFIEDFKARIGEHTSGVSPEDGIHQELSKYYNDINDLVEGTRGPLGIKAQDIEKLVPEMSPRMDAQVQDIAESLNNQIAKMAEKPDVYPPRFVDKLQSHLDTFTSNLSKPDLTSAELFKETEDLKRIFQQYGKYDKVINELSPEHQFVQDAKKIAQDLKGKLEDTDVWGRAGQRQKDFNAAVSDYLPKLKDFESKFTTKLADEGRLVDPGKVASFVRGIGKPNAEIRSSVLDKFLEASEQMKKEVGKIHQSLGVTDSIPESPLSMTKAAMKEPTLGAQAADTLLGKIIGEGSGLGATVGGIFGHREGFGVLGAMFGAHVLGPMFKSVLPGITKAIINASKMSAPGFKAAVDYATEVSRGQALLDRGVKALFSESNRAITNETVSDSERRKLEKHLDAIKMNPQAYLNQQTHLSHYLPDHEMAVAQASSGAASYLAALKPAIERPAPLDSPQPPSPFAEAKYRNALNIAQNPAIILNKVKEGTLTAEDLQHIGSMYPSLYRGLQQKITSELAAKLSKGASIPYKTRIGLSTFMAQPMDSTFTPAAIMKAQQVQAFPLTAPQNPQGSPKGSKSSPALQKMPSTFQTASQSRELRRNKI